MGGGDDDWVRVEEGGALSWVGLGQSGVGLD